MPAEVRIFGVRHHGPGSARALTAALDRFQPNVVLLEGPPDADDLLRFVPRLTPPVALLVYREDQPAACAFYPFARFSPEWNALVWAHTNHVEARFCDLPQAFQLGAPAEEEEHPGEDPLTEFGHAAGYPSHAAWWDREVELRGEDAGHFEAVLEGMAALRTRPAEGRELRREAWMRRTLREAEREGHGRIAVVVGAWHAPALHSRPKVSEDDAALRGLQKVKVGATWVPWSNTRLGQWTGYGAGVEAPGWYEAVWSDPGTAPTHWLVDAARALRDADLDAPPASVVEALRLAEALASLRDRATVGLPEMDDAVEAVLTKGEPALQAIISARVRVGTSLGSVPDDVPAFPLQRDLEARQRAVRLKPTDELKQLDLDLREDGGRARSALLRQLALLGIDWGELADASGRGSFRERWQLRWVPALAARVVEAARLGTTVVAAAEAAVRNAAATETSLGVLASLVDDAMLAELGVAPEVLDILVRRAAEAGDVVALLRAVPPLARVARYGDVRGRSVEVRPVLDGLVARATVGLAHAAFGRDAAAAALLGDAIAATDEALTMLEARPADWVDALAALTEAPVHGRLRGQIARLRLSRGELDADALVAVAGRALSPGVTPADAAGWIEGLLAAGAGGLLVLPGLWSALDVWLVDQPNDRFLEAVPLLRRAFAGFSAPERARMARMVADLGAPPAPAVPLDPARVARLLPTLKLLLGGTGG